MNRSVSTPQLERASPTKAKKMACRGRPSISHDNTLVQDFIASYLTVSELCEDHPQIDNIFSGVLELKTEGDTSTRSLLRSQLFHILQTCPLITTSSVTHATGARYARQTVERYAALTRVISKAIEKQLPGLHRDAPVISDKKTRDVLDAPYHAELRSLGLMWPWKVGG